MVLELGKVEYHATQYSSIPNSNTFYKIKKKKKIYTVLEFGKLEYCIIYLFIYFLFCFVFVFVFVFVFFFFLFGDNQQINIKIKISSFFF